MTDSEKEFKARGDLIKMLQYAIQGNADEIQFLESKLAVAVEALKFYGNEMNYSVDDYHGVSGEMRKRCVLYSDCEERNDVYSYAGMRARETLSKLSYPAYKCAIENDEVISMGQFFKSALETPSTVFRAATDLVFDRIVEELNKYGDTSDAATFLNENKERILK